MEETESVRPAELITLPDVAALVRPLVADSALVSGFTIGVAIAFETPTSGCSTCWSATRRWPATSRPALGPGRVSGESSLAIVLAYFNEFDIAAHGGDPDGKISTSDLEAIRNDLSLPSYVRDAASHLLNSPTLRYMAASS